MVATEPARLAVLMRLVAVLAVLVLVLGWLWAAVLLVSPLHLHTLHTRVVHTHIILRVPVVSQQLGTLSS